VIVLDRKEGCGRKKRTQECMHIRDAREDESEKEKREDCKRSDGGGERNGRHLCPACVQKRGWTLIRLFGTPFLNDEEGREEILGGG